jgi:hypothetical protein
MFVAFRYNTRLFHAFFREEMNESKENILIDTSCMRPVYAVLRTQLPENIFAANAAKSTAQESDVNVRFFRSRTTLIAGETIDIAEKCGNTLSLQSW